MTSRIGTKGQVVIPQQLRAELGIHPGDEVEVWRDGDHLALSLVRARTPLRGRFDGHDLVEDLLDDRRADQDREQTGS